MRQKDNMLGQHLPEGDLVVGFCNNGYTVIATNWIESLRRVGLYERTLLFALDGKAANALDKAGIRNFPWYRNTPTEFVDLHGPKWGSLMFAKLDIVHHLLRLGRSLLYSDTDVVFLRNPLDYLRAATRAFDLSIQFESRDMLCAGFYYIKPTPNSIRLVDVHRDDTERLSKVRVKHSGSSGSVHCDNLLINRRLATRAYDDGLASPEAHYNKLDRNLFSGRAWWTNTSPKAPFVVHFNCLTGKDSKIAEMKKYEMWYCDDEPLRS